MIVVIIGAVAIFWIIVSKFAPEIFEEETISPEFIAENMELSIVSFEEGILKLSIRRTAGEENIESLKIVFEDGNGTVESYNVMVVIGPSETKVVSINISNSSLGEIVKISVYATFSGGALAEMIPTPDDGEYSSRGGGSGSSSGSGGSGETEYCGDGITNGNEECDDGNNRGGDGCSAICEEEIICEENTYYVDSTNGDDSNDGKCSKQNGTGIGPWKTTSKVNSFIFNSGDFVKFRSGEVFRGYEETNEYATLFPVSGVTYTFYGTKDKPIISGAIDATDSSRYQWTATGTNNEYKFESIGGGSPGIIQTDGVWMDGEYLANHLYANVPGSLPDNQWAWADDTVYLKLEGGTDPNGAGLIEIAQKDSAVFMMNKANVVLNNLHLKHGNRNLYRGLDYRGTLTMRDVDSSVVQNCIIEEASDYAVVFTRRLTNSFLVNNTIRNLRRENYYNNDLTRNIVTLTDSDNNNISKNLISNNPLGSDCMYLAEGSSYNYVEYNEISGPCANAIYIRGTSSANSNNHIRYNYIHNIFSETYYGGGIGIQVRDGASENYIYGNVLMQLRGPIMQSDGKDNPVTGTHIYNNVIYNTWYDGSGGRSGAVKVWGGTNEGTEVKNNLIISIGTGLTLDSHNGAVIDNNCVFPLDGADAIGGTNVGEITNTITDNPLIFNSNPTNPGDLRLTSDSPCKDVGLNLGSEFEMELGALSNWPEAVELLNQNSYETGWEIGAFVYDSHECDFDSECDDGVWCNGAETCDGSNKCQLGTAPCTNHELSCLVTCVEATQECNIADDGVCENPNDCFPDVCVGVGGDSITGCENQNPSTSYCTNPNGCGIIECVSGNCEYSDCPSPPPLPFDDNLVLYYPFDNVDDYNDESGNGNDGSCIECPVYTTSHDGTGAYDFDGVNDYLNAGGADSLVFGTDDFTVASWIRADSLVNPLGYNGFIYYGSPFGNGYGLRKYSTGNTLQFCVRNEQENCVAQWSSSPMTAGEWHHVVGVRDNTGSNEDIYLYVDGAEYLNRTGLDLTTITGGDVLKIGMSEENRYMDATIDEVRIYDIALDAGQVAQLYENSISLSPEIKEEDLFERFVDWIKNLFS